MGKKQKWRSCIIRGPNSSLGELESAHCLRRGASPTPWRHAFELLTWQKAVWVTESPGTSGNGRRGRAIGGRGISGCATYSRCRASGPLWQCWNAPLLRDDRPIFLQQYGVICEGTSLWEWGWVIKGREDSRGHALANSDDSHQLTGVWSLVIRSIIMELNAPLTRRWARSGWGGPFGACSSRGRERNHREQCGEHCPPAFSYVGKALELYDGKLLWCLVQTPFHYCYCPTKPAQSQSPALTCCGWALATVLTVELGTFIWLLSHEWDLPSTGSLNVRAFMLFREV